MPTPFHFEHRFRAPSPAAVLDVVFDAAARAAQDAAVDVASRVVLADEDTAATRRMRFLVHPRRQLPAIARALVKGDLSFEEELVWTKALDRVDYDIRPRVLSGKTHIVARYQLTADGAGQVLRRYQGTATVEVPLIGARIERVIVDDLGRSLAAAAQITQAHIDRRVGP